jgi:hypothetical protein
MNSHLLACYSSKLSYIYQYAPTRFGWGRIGCAPKVPSKPLNLAQARPFFKHGIFLFCWVDYCNVLTLSLCRLDGKSTVSVYSTAVDSVSLCTVCTVSWMGSIDYCSLYSIAAPGKVILN